jgi:hypothetical protein
MAATNMSNPMAKEAILVRKPKNNAIGPRNSVRTARKAKTAGIPREAEEAVTWPQTLQQNLRPVEGLKFALCA